MKEVRAPHEKGKRYFSAAIAGLRNWRQLDKLIRGCIRRGKHMQNLSPIILSATGFAAILLLIAVYNGLVRARNAVSNALAQISVQLQRRYDLIPNLVAVAKRYLEHERETLEAVVSARNLALGAAQNLQLRKGPAALAAVSSAENQLTGALTHLFALQESYPQLRADQTMAQLSEELSSTENRVSFARQAYNDAVMSYDNKRLSFPSLLIAGLFGFAAYASWELEDQLARQPLRVSFS
ncbi:LemA family protein [Rhodospirillaceae bacterium LM-1]|nr:LemA family protein [Rhodospirillaceae bacterium LM-1]